MTKLKSDLLVLEKLSKLEIVTEESAHWFSNSLVFIQKYSPELRCSFEKLLWSNFTQHAQGPKSIKSISPCFLVRVSLQFLPDLFLLLSSTQTEIIFNTRVHRMARIQPHVLFQGGRKTHMSKEVFLQEIPQLQWGNLKANQALSLCAKIASPDRVKSQ